MIIRIQDLIIILKLHRVNMDYIQRLYEVK
jgi:hypothetical protein